MAEAVAVAVAVDDEAANAPDTATKVVAFLRWTFATAVWDGDHAWAYGGPGVEKNDGAHRVSLMQAVALSLLGLDYSYFVYPAPSVLACDGDDDQQAAGLRALAAELRTAGYRPVLLASGRPGGLHLWARLPDAATRAAWDARAVTLAGTEAVLRREGLRPPFAPHRSGLPVALLEPATAHEALAALTTTPVQVVLPPAQETTQEAHQTAQEARSDTAASRPYRELSPDMAALLRDGDQHGRYPSRSELVQGLVNSMYQRGWSLEQMLVALRDPTNRGGEKVQGRRLTSATRYVSKCWEKASVFCNANRPVRTRGQVDDELDHFDVVLSHADDQGAFRYRGGPLDVRVLRELLKLSRYVGKVAPDASSRDLAVQVGAHYTTVAKALRRLHQRGWLLPVARPRAPQDTRQDAHGYRLTPPGVVFLNATHGSQQGGCKACVALRDISPDVRADVFCRSGLGQQAGRMLERLLVAGDAALTVAALAGGWCSPAVAREALRRLRAAGVAVGGRRGWTLTLEASTVAGLERLLVRAAARRGTQGASVQRRAQHVREREAFQEALEANEALMFQVRTLARKTGWPKVTVLHQKWTLRRWALAGRADWLHFIDTADAGWLRAARTALRADRPTRIRLVPDVDIMPERRAAACYRETGKARTTRQAGNVGMDGA